MKLSNRLIIAALLNSLPTIAAQDLTATTDDDDDDDLVDITKRHDDDSSLPSSSSSPKGKIAIMDVTTSVYNPRTKLCPNLSAGISGYTSLTSLQLDLEAYFHSLTSSPTISLVPTPIPTNTPTSTPSVNPSEGPTPSPSELPTKAPITLRPSPDPTSSIRERKEPTASPAPTIEIIIVGPPGQGSTGPGPTDPGTTTSPTDPTRRLVENVSPAMSPGVLSESRKRLRGHKMADSILQTDPFLRVMGDGVNGDAYNEGSQMPMRDGLHEEVKDENAEAIPPATSFTTDPQAAILKFHQDSHLLEDGELISFNICPNSVFSFTNETALNEILSTSSNDTSSAYYPPLTLETPLHYNPIAINCIEDFDNSTNCTFIGGNVHMLLNNDALLDEDPEDDFAYNISISGITFREASHASILMQDPRASKITFEQCTWENNTGMAAILIDGQYVVPVEETTTTSSTFVFSSSTSSTDFARVLFGDSEEEDEQLEVFDERETLLDNGIEEGWEKETKVMPTMFNWGQGSEFGYGEVEDPELSAIDAEEEDDENEEMQTMRLLDEDDDGPRSIILIRNSTFSGNTGNATIIVTSFSNDESAASRRYLASLSHSIHLKLKETSFISQNEETSVIANFGGKLQSSGCTFTNNTAESIIMSEKGSVKIVRTSFSGNEIRGDEGMIVLDSESVLEKNEDNCVDEDVDIVRSLVSVERKNSEVCDGIIISGGDCQPFDDSCPDRDGENEDTTTTTSTNPTQDGDKDGGTSTTPTTKDGDNDDGGSSDPGESDCTKPRKRWRTKNCKARKRARKKKLKLRQRKKKKRTRNADIQV